MYNLILNLRLAGGIGLFLEVGDTLLNRSSISWGGGAVCVCVCQGIGWAASVAECCRLFFELAEC